jgi:putative transposase
VKRKRFKEEQIVGILREARRGDKTIGEICRAHGVSENTFYVWRKKYGEMEVSEVRQYRELVKENARLKKLVAQLCLDNDVLKEALSKNW